jgi:hypothetical protein
MRVMVLVKATTDSEAGTMPSTDLLDAMGKYNEELVNAGIMLAGEGLHPSSKETGRSPKRASWWPASGCGRSRTWPRRSRGRSAAPIRCPARARSRFGRSSKRPISARP